VNNIANKAHNYDSNFIIDASSRHLIHSSSFSSRPIVRHAYLNDGYSWLSLTSRLSNEIGP
jgi:hypothetical protein